MEEKETDELLQIWEANDRSDYREEAFGVIREVLVERGVDLPRQKPSSVGPTSEQDRRSSGGFFSFRRMVSAKIVKILYSLGALLITITGLWIIAVGFEDGILMRSAGIAVVILGNLAWRLVCEAAIVLFSIHEVLVSIERKLG
jgi:hypothetical protein